MDEQTMIRNVRMPMDSLALHPEKWISAPAKAGRSGRRRWVTIVEISEDRRFVKVKNSHPLHPAWWTRLSSLRNRAGNPIVTVEV